MNIIARLKPGVTVAMARAQMPALAAAMRADYPGDYKEVGNQPRGALARRRASVA